MEIQLKELIEQIKKDGVEAAEAKAASIIDSAKTEAEKIIADAKAEAESIIKNAKEENERFVRSGEDAIRQAGRNLLISFRESVVKELDTVAGAKISDVYTPEVLCDLIPKVVEAVAKGGDTAELTVLLNSGDLKRIEDSLTAALKAKLSKGVTIRANDSFDGGFRIASDDNGVYYDYSAKSVTEMLSAYLNPKVTALMKEVGKE